MSTEIVGYNKDTLLSMLHCRVVEMKYRKADEEVRILRGTLKEDLVPKQVKAEDEESPSPNLVTLWDIDAQGWRSIRTDRIMDVL